MKKNFAYSADFDEITENEFRKAKYLGRGNNGIVYELPNNKVIKIFLKRKVCKDEGSILYKTNGSKYFPKLYARGSLYVIRAKVYGERLDKYIKKYGLSDELSLNVYNLLNEFKRLKFLRLDTRCKDIYVDSDQSVMLIDPKKAYKRKVDYPRHLMKGLDKIGALDTFLSQVGKINKKKQIKWIKKYARYKETLN
ncbi:protein kinase [Clostridium sp. BJN0001]|uniref:protein kinase n=1 Tax=Clostridium sp. BJN0001 TaxID=2930219 RepID=UPI001FD40659|nr:protein kinase [Clostridium sp. BJN0001]